jgi:PIN domain nuclease of toxin-antitoxin system
VRILVDTHCWLWAMAAPQHLNATARELLESPEHEVFLSAASAWEIAIKFALGKLRLPLPPSEYVPHRIAEQGMASLPIAQAHALRVAALPHHHRDPFDRILVAQAQLERCRLLTVDEQLRPYDVELIWAATER